MLKRKNTNINFLYDIYCSVKDNNEKKWGKAEFTEFIQKKHNIFILSEPNPVGYLKATITKDQMEIISFIIDKKFRKKGIGKALLNKVLVIAANKKVNSIFLEVSVENKIAINLYKKSNFLKVGERKNYYSRKDRKVNAYIMKLNFS
ncbi:MAG: ribosomal-protein-alanine N-acetyltransferase [Pelagibacterales bacterium]|nr:ribosomal-protein-alanine N-acetyltransferase [Pelagibacterales bacterium]OUU63152.1 MAG: ribosomal-protein-alanine N-acetyltransferase [Alphaproteobacteria bacterium TMED62]|tara:strand:+ start:5331 stop:5771 length:441 start_codon:yes stop_codon:yes gene_type:complete